MKPMHNRDSESMRRRNDDLYDSDNGSRQPVGDDLFKYDRRFDSDYANFDTEHAADYQRHTDFADEYNNIREGYYRNRGTQAGNSMPSEYPDAYGNRYGKDGDYSRATRYNDQRNRPYTQQPDSGRRQSGGTEAYGESGYRSSNDLAGYGGGGSYQQGGMSSFGADKDRYGAAASYSNTGGSIAGHRGKGPKGYVRSDERIREDVSDRLRDDEHIDAGDVDVSVTNCEVILSGTVESRFAKRHAEDLAESVSGVRNVENRIRVKA